MTKVHNLTLCLVKARVIDLSPAIKPVQITLYGLPTLRLIDTSSQLGVICKLIEGALNALIQIINKDIKQDGLQY